MSCTLFLLIFVLAIEPLAPLLWGFNEHQTAASNFSICRWLLFISDPLFGLSEWLTLLTMFERLSGEKVNFHKSELIPITSVDVAYFGSVPSKCTYLGLWVTHDHIVLSKDNFLLLFNLKQDIECWQPSPRSLNFQNAPIHYSVFLSSWQSLFSHLKNRNHPLFEIKKKSKKHKNCLQRLHTVHKVAWHSQISCIIIIIIG